MISFCIINRFQLICKKSPKTTTKTYFYRIGQKSPVFDIIVVLINTSLDKRNKIYRYKASIYDYEAFLCRISPIFTNFYPWSWNMRNITQNLGSPRIASLMYFQLKSIKNQFGHQNCTNLHTWVH